MSPNETNLFRGHGSFHPEEIPERKTSLLIIVAGNAMGPRPVPSSHLVFPSQSHLNHGPARPVSLSREQLQDAEDEAPNNHPLYCAVSTALRA